MPDELIFIYNADSGFINAVEDYFHKIVRPSTYNCNLCTVTYGNLGMEPEWKKFTEELPLPVRFLHKDEFENEFPNQRAEYPSAYLNIDNKLQPFITEKEMNELMILKQLIQLVEDKLA